MDLNLTFEILGGVDFFFEKKELADIFFRKKIGAKTFLLQYLKFKIFLTIKTSSILGQDGRAV